MINLRDLEFLDALARRKHFARAAEDCGISQPAFSMGIRNIEEKLGTAVVKRGNRFQGFTAEGEALIRHARKILDDLKVMEQEVRSARGEVTGNLAIGVIPTAVIFAAELVEQLQRKFPGIRANLHTDTSLAIQQGLDAGRFDAGITYAEGVSPEMHRIDPLYDETYQLLAPAHIAPRQAGNITWEEAAALPLCLLETEMQNRRILDAVFSNLGLVPDVVTETSGFTAAMVLAGRGLAATILPKLQVETFGGLEGTVALALCDPDLSKEVCLITPPRDPGLPTVEVLRRICAAVS